MNDREIEVLEKEEEERDAQYQKMFDRAKRIYDISIKLSKPKGLIFKRCPKCNRKLKRYIVPLSVLMYLKYYICKCGYEYAERC